MTDEMKKDLCILYIREYKNFPFEITDDEIVEKYGVVIEYMVANFDDVLKGNTGNVSSVKEDNSEIKYTTREVDAFDVLPPMLQKILGNPYIRLF